MKRLVLCCDGTWSIPDQMDGNAPCPTNVTKFALGVANRDKNGVEQRVFYHRGIGTGRWGRIRGGAFCAGLSRDVQDVYRFIVENYQPGDELYFVGFSRGAFTARSTAGFVRKAGVLRRRFVDLIGVSYDFYRNRSDITKPSSIEAGFFRRSYSHDEAPIHCIAVWDTVGALGIPLNGMRWVNLFNRRYQFHDTELSSKVKFAFHALAIDEKRGPFTPTLWTQQPNAVEQTLKQVWFAGTHSDVGGGYRNATLADVCLMWMVEQVTSAGLEFLLDAFPKTAPPNAPEPVILADPKPLGPLHESRTWPWWRLLPASPRTLGEKDPGHEAVAKAAIDRLNWDPKQLDGSEKLDKKYEPGNQRKYLASKHSVIETVCGPPQVGPPAGPPSRSTGAPRE
ncbi:Uncharacterized alpha/beta hydrolase domain [Arthrobacter sp. ok909]|uniref:DUF2235 domain-containing protein n=1 Tax=Arthrobacter sp. ok909 TaxID=1761746 RepID=UPI0008859B3A|nr:DUF2235 domain-containing protein [Arthrobacter sp. ok909]SDP49038.1 Uncharacterized alpha/beta hydrolase domain [Arthrobacter sp. ok909]